MKRTDSLILPVLSSLLLAVAPVRADVVPGGGTGSTRRLEVAPGETKSNGDVTVANHSDQIGENADAHVTPKDGDESSASTVETENGFAGTISGLEGNDTVNLGPNNGANEDFQTLVYGEGGTVNVSGGSFVTVVNTSPPGGADMTVTLPSGTELTVGAGSSVEVETQ